MRARAIGRANDAFLVWRWERHDQHVRVTVTAFIGLLAAAAMALFGLPPVDLHGPLHRFGFMDPFCGGTRAARYTAQGQWVLAWQYNPLGIATALGASAATLRAVVGLLSRRWLTVRLHWTPWRRRVVLAVGVALFVAFTVRQQLRADLLTQDTWMFR
jgi:hypothetical protein